jgi:hypothetical protein
MQKSKPLASSKITGTVTTIVTLGHAIAGRSGLSTVSFGASGGAPGAQFTGSTNVTVANSAANISSSAIPAAHASAGGGTCA